MNFHWTRTKIVATLGPVSSSPSVLEAFMRSGADLLRLNFAHGSHPEHLRLIKSIRSVSKKLGQSVGILQDLPGPKLRVGTLQAESLEIARNDEVTLVSTPAPARGSGGTVIHIEYPRLTDDIKRGHSIFIADGTIRLKAISVKKEGVLCQVAAGGTVRKGNGVNMPGTSLSLNAFTKGDRTHLAFGIAQGVDFAGVSFAGNAADILRTRRFAEKLGRAPFIIAKIERREALKNLKSIIEAADGIMVARGDLGVEVPYSEIPGIQQDIVERSQKMGKPVIVATQVLESMVENARPTRAEATDVSNAIMEGADAIMLSGETSIGKYPVEAVQALNEVIRATEKRRAASGRDNAVPELHDADTVIHEACRIAQGLGVKAIVVPARTGYTATRVSRFRPPTQILTLVNNETMSRKFSLYWGIRTLFFPHHLSSEILLKRVPPLLLKRRLIRAGQKILLLSGGQGRASQQTLSIHIIHAP